jgi:protein-tyrosine phosphatase
MHVHHIDKAVEFIEQARREGGKAMSHCWYGKNRSVTMLVAYLMKYADMTATEANDLIKHTRPQADPYWDPLEDYAEYLKEYNE